ncbi:MAG: hypothetical protein ACRDG3_09830 [Tepidiformaceae bacterium]
MTGLLVVVPTEREHAALTRASAAVVCGVGSEAGAALAEILAARRPSLVLLAGFAGALDPSLKAGTTILARESTTAGGEPLAPDVASNKLIEAALHQSRRPFVRSRLLTVDGPVMRASEKRDLWNTHGAGGVDMETHAVAEACVAAGIPWVALRVVLDGAGQSMPKGIAEWHGDSDDKGVALAALKRPQDWPGFVRLAIQYPKARTALRRSVRLAVRAVNAEAAPTAST